MSHNKSFYLISNGKVTPCKPGTEFDGTESVVAFAATPREALALATLYDAGKISPDNVWYNGAAYSALKR